MPGEEIRIGPFVGGLNTFSDASSVEDAELVECVNFELDIDGSLYSRPPIVDIGVDITLGETGNAKYLGYFVTAGGAPYLIASDGLSKTYYYDGTSWHLLTDTISASALCQFNEQAWLLAPIGSTNPGGYWTPTGGWTAQANMPRGACVVANKERLWVGLGENATTNSTRLYLTDIVDGIPTWSSPASYIEIGQGDGQAIVDLVVYYSDLVIFKQGSTYRFAYDADPSVGTVSRVSDNVGATSTGCYAAYENRLYVLFDNKVYEFSNYSFDRMNMKVPLKANNPDVTLSEYYSISVWADRLFVSYYDRTFVYSLRTRVWSEWSSTVLVNIGRILPLPFEQGETPVAFTYATTPRDTTLYRIRDEYGVDSEEMECYFVTKNYDYQTPHRWKRLFWWGVDTLCKTSMDVQVRPISYAMLMSWADLADYAWEDLNTWLRPLDEEFVVSDTVVTESLSGGRKYIKFLKSIRFRQISFRVSVSLDGSSSEGPARVYGLLTGVRDKAMLSERIS